MFIPKQKKTVYSPEDREFLPARTHVPIGKLKSLHSTTLKQSTTCRLTTEKAHIFSVLRPVNPKQIEPFRIDLSRIYTHNHL